MLPLVIVLSLLSGALLGLSLFSLWKSKEARDSQRDWFAPYQELEGRQEVMEMKWKRLLEEMEERIERGNDAWRRYRSGEAARERRAQSLEESEGQPADPAQEILPFDEEGSDPRGLSYMPGGVDGATEEPWRTVAKQLAASIVGGGN